MAGVDSHRKNLESALAKRAPKPVEDEFPEAEPFPDLPFDGPEKKQSKGKKSKKSKEKKTSKKKDAPVQEPILTGINNRTINSVTDETREQKAVLSMPQNANSKNMVEYQEVGSQLHYHTSTGNWEVVEELLNQSPQSINARSKDGRTILHVAATLGHLHIVKNLIELKVDVDPLMDNGITPLMLSVAKGQTDVVQLLLSAKASIMITSEEDSYTALHLATMHQQIKSARALLEHARKEHPPIISKLEPVEGQKSESKKEKKSKSSDKKSIATLNFVDMKSNKGYTALHLSIVENDVDMVKMLVSEYNADVTAVSNRNWTPLHFAVHIKNRDICEFLLDKNSDLVNRLNESENTPYDIAVHNEFDELLEMLKPTKSIKRKKSKQKISRSESFSLTPRKSKSKRMKAKQSLTEVPPPPQSLLDLYTLPEYIGNDESVLEAISNNPQLFEQMKENPELFLQHIPPEMQKLLLEEVERNPDLIKEIVEIGKDVMMELIEEHPEQLLCAVKNPLKLFKTANTPAKMMKLVRQLEENPMILMKEEVQNNPEVFFLKQIRQNPRMLYLVVQKVRDTKPHLLPLLKVVVGIDPDSIEDPMDEKSGITKMRNKLVKAAVSKLMKKMKDGDDEELETMEIGGFDLSAQGESLKQFRNMMKPGGLDSALAESGLNTPLFTIEEVDEDPKEIKTKHDADQETLEQLANDELD